MSAFEITGALESSRVGLAAPGLCRLGVQSSVVGRVSVLRGYIPTDFSVTHASEGPQLMISWSDPTEVSASPFDYQLRRGAFSHPRTMDEGTLISSGVSSGDMVVSDRTQMVPEQAYYYTLFVKDPTQGSSPGFEEPWFTHVDLKASGMSFSTGYWGERLFALLPDLHQTMDRRPDLGGEYEQRKLETVTAGSSSPKVGQAFHFNETQQTRHGQLARYLKLLGTQMDEVRRLVSRHVADLDPSTAFDKLLTYLGHTYGWKANRELPVVNRRREVAGAVPFYRRKGTTGAWARQGENAANLGSSHVFEVRDAVLLSTSGPKSFGTHTIADDPIGLPTSDTLIATSTNSPSALGTRSRGLMFFGRGDLEPGYLKFSYSEDTPDTRAYTLFPGDLTVEFWLRVNQWPVIDSSLIDVEDELEVVSPIITMTCRSPGGSAQDTYNCQVALRTRQTENGGHAHEVIMRSGLAADLDVVLVESADSGQMFESFHFAVTRRVTGGSMLSPEDVHFEWNTYLNGSLTSSATGRSGSILQSSVDSSEGILVGPRTPDEVASSDWVIDELRIWRIEKSTTDISSNYAGTVSSHVSNLVLHSRFNDLQSPNPNIFGSLLQPAVIQDTSVVEGHAEYLPPSVSPNIAHGVAPVHVGSAMPDPYVVDSLPDQVRRRGRRIGTREAVVSGTTVHLRAVRFRALTNR